MPKLLNKQPDPAVAAAHLLTPRELDAMHAYWRACNYLAVGMIYLKDNPLLRERLTTEHAWRSVAGTGDEKHVEILLDNQAVQVHPDE